MSPRKSRARAGNSLAAEYPPHFRFRFVPEDPESDVLDETPGELHIEPAVDPPEPEACGDRQGVFDADADPEDA